MATILVVDDERNIRSGLCIAFEDEGYDTLEAYGLDDPFATLTATTPEGETLTLALGNTTTDGDGVLNLYAVWERIKCVVTLIVDGQIYAYLEVPAGTPTEDVLGAAGISDVMYKLDGNYPNA